MSSSSLAASMRNRGLARALPMGESLPITHVDALAEAGWRGKHAKTLSDLIAAWPARHCQVLLDITVRGAFGSLHPETVLAWVQPLLGDEDGFVEAVLTDGSDENQAWLTSRFSRWTSEFGTDLGLAAYSAGLSFDDTCHADDLGVLTLDWLASDRHYLPADDQDDLDDLGSDEGDEITWATADVIDLQVDDEGEDVHLADEVALNEEATPVSLDKPLTEVVTVEVVVAPLTAGMIGTPSNISDPAELGVRVDPDPAQQGKDPALIA